MPRNPIASSAPSTAKGTDIMTPIGSETLSYCAARISSTKIRPKTKASVEVEPAPISSRASPDHS
ncbi:hypothetical protein D3C83_232500 [compost metagenome]